MSVTKLNFYLEERQLKSGTNLPLDLARHIFARRVTNVAVVCENPRAAISPVRKSWLAIIKTLEREYANSMDQNRKKEVLKQIDWMSDLRFTTHANKVDAEVYFVENSADLPSSCKTIYLMRNFTIDELITKKIAGGGLLVTYM